MAEKHVAASNKRCHKSKEQKASKLSHWVQLHLKFFFISKDKIETSSIHRVFLINPERLISSDRQQYSLGYSDPEQSMTQNTSSTIKNARNPDKVSLWTYPRAAANFYKLGHKYIIPILIGKITRLSAFLMTSLMSIQAFFYNLLLRPVLSQSTIATNKTKLCFHQNFHITNK